MSVKKKQVAKKKVVKKTAVKKQVAPAAAKKSVAKKAVTKKKVAKKRATVKKSTAPRRSTATSQVSARERYEMIATMAYYRAEKRNFATGHETDDWFECEQIIDKMLKNQ